MNKILVTGANGFIGHSLCEELVKRKKKVCGAIRNKSVLKDYNNIEYFEVGNIDPQTNWESALSNVDCIVHCAGIAHVKKKKKLETERVLNNTNVEGTKKLALQAAKAGIKRLIFLSSIKVNGENTYDVGSKKKNSMNNDKKIFTHLDEPSPKDLYGFSKWKAEEKLLNVSGQTDLEVVILRLPLVYGSGVKGNLNRLIKLIESGIPLPFKMIKNQRSMIGLDNLIDLIILCIDHPKAAGKTFLVSDGEDLSTPELLRYIASSMNCNLRLFSLPIIFLKFISNIFNYKYEFNKLIGSLKIDNQYTYKILNWLPPVSASEGIRRMIKIKRL
jgi:nucleoside-diphosphate-sugar epimerase